MTAHSASNAQTVRRLLRRFRGLQAHLLPDEEPLASHPVIWNSQQHGRVACDAILTNRRLLGYYQIRFPRPRLFLEAIPLEAITSITLRSPQSKPLLHELLIISGQRRVLLRAPRRVIENLYDALQRLSESERASQTTESAQTDGEEPDRALPPRFARQPLASSAEHSPAGIAVIFACGLILEIIAVFLWQTTGSLATSLPPFGAGLLAVVTAVLVYRQR
uniref:YokE-like PH domain-containing protein n=1 Tax=Thermogemmatispora argillosa TaxID=2045280 RepID=A0A455T5F3_9CHLR|nr:hypothetical protein KTA_09030 [Thermogemmatispora argillosa]